MAQVTILAAGLTAANSSDIVLADGQTKTVGMFGAAVIPGAIYLTVMQRTPGLSHRVADLTVATPAVVLAGPGTFFVSRPIVPASVGVFTDS